MINFPKLVEIYLKFEGTYFKNDSTKINRELNCSKNDIEVSLREGYNKVRMIYKTKIVNVCDCKPTSNDILYYVLLYAWYDLRGYRSSKNKKHGVHNDTLKFIEETMIADNVGGYVGF